MKNILKKSIGGMLILITLFFTFTSCDETNTELDDGLKVGFEYSGDESPAFIAAYESDTRVFDIDDVTLTFYYGHIFGKTEEEVEHYRNHGVNYPSFDLYFEDENGTRYLIRHIDENFVSTKYHCTWVVDDSWNITDIDYNYSETITMLKELFVKEKGWISFSIYGTNVNSFERQEERITGVSIYYIKSGDLVTLYSNVEYYRLGLGT